jgi:hypothetical protein
VSELGIVAARAWRRVLAHIILIVFERHLDLQCEGCDCVRTGEGGSKVSDAKGFDAELVPGLQVWFELVWMDVIARVAQASVQVVGEVGQLFRGRG